MPYFRFIFLFALFISFQLSAQNADTTLVETNVMDTQSSVTTEVDLGLSYLNEPKVYDPKKALLWSIIPGGGQVYNRRWWKVPLVFSAFSGVAAVLNFNSSNYNRFETAYQQALAGETHEFSGTITSISSLKGFRDNFNKTRQTSYFYLVGIYLLQGVEAYVDTQLRDFDMDEGLSHFQLQPVLVPGVFSDQAPALALELRYTF